MANKKNEEKLETTFSIEDLRKNCKTLFNVEVEVFDGAFHNVSSEKISKEEAQIKIKEWLGKEV